MFLSTPPPPPLQRPFWPFRCLSLCPLSNCLPLSSPFFPSLLSILLSPALSRNHKDSMKSAWTASFFRSILLADMFCHRKYREVLLANMAWLSTSHLSIVLTPLPVLALPHSFLLSYMTVFHSALSSSLSFTSYIRLSLCFLSLSVFLLPYMSLSLPWFSNFTELVLFPYKCAYNLS
jgi:hypothetical protein